MTAKTTKRRPPGEAKVYQRASDGRWCASLRIEGKARVYYGRTKKEAREKRDAARKQHARGEWVPASRLTVSAWCAEWLERRRHTKRRGRALGDGTRLLYAGLIENYIVPHLGRLRVADLDVRRVERALDAIREQGSAQVAQRTRRLLHQICEDARKRKLLALNPIPDVGEPDHAVKKGRAATSGEVEKLLAAAGRYEPRERRTTEKARAFHRAFITAAADTGLRRGELVALTWEALDLDEARLEVRAAARRVTREDGEGGEVIAIDVTGPPKTATGRRTLPLTARAVDALRAHWKRSGEPFEGLAFPSRDGSPMWDANYARVFEKLRKAAGLDAPDEHGRRLTFHSLRRGYLTAIAQHATTATVTALAGHSEPGITYRHYIGGDLDAQRRAVAGWEAARGSGAADEALAVH